MDISPKPLSIPLSKYCTNVHVSSTLRNLICISFFFVSILIMTSNNLVLISKHDIGEWGIGDLHLHMMSLIGFVKATSLEKAVVKCQKWPKKMNSQSTTLLWSTTALQYWNKDPSAVLQWWRWFYTIIKLASKTFLFVGHCVGAYPPHPRFTEAPSTSLSTQTLMRTTRLSRRS